LRTTGPEGIIIFFRIKKGDKLEWKIDIKNNERIAIVRKKNELDKNTRRIVNGFVNFDKVKRN
jgi:hypothetical protein